MSRPFVSKWGLPLLLLAGLLLRLPLLAPDWRVTNDLATLRTWAHRIQNESLIELYDGQTQLYPPPMLYGLSLAAFVELALPVRLRGNDAAINFLLKLTPALADVGTAALLAFSLSGRQPLNWITAALYVFNPAILYVSAFWGQLDSIYTFFLVAAVLALEQKKYRIAWLSWACALGSKVLAIVLAPIIVPGTLRRGGIQSLVWGIIMLGAVAGLSVLPWLLNDQLDARFFASIGFGSRTPRVDVSAYNAWYLVLLGNVHAISSLERPVPNFFNLREIGLLLYTMYASFLAWRLWQKPSRDLALPSALSALALYLFATDVHERYLFPVLAFLLLAAARASISDRSHAYIYWVSFALITLTFSFNLITIAPPSFMPSFNLIAHPTDSIQIALLKNLAILVAFVHLGIFAVLTCLYWQKGNAAREAA